MRPKQPTKRIRFEILVHSPMEYQLFEMLRALFNDIEIGYDLVIGREKSSYQILCTKNIYIILNRNAHIYTMSPSTNMYQINHDYFSVVKLMVIFILSRGSTCNL